MNKEVRSQGDAQVVDSRHVEGYAIVFNSLSRDLGGFKEIVEPTALDGVLEKSTVLALLNHDASRGVLAKYRNMQGSLTLTPDEHGLKYSFDAPNTQLGDELIEMLRRGDITTSSFAFTIERDEWSKQGGQTIRTIKKIDRLFDVSPVYDEAYSDTTVALRSFNEFNEQQNEDEKPKKEDKYYVNLKQNLF